MKNIHLVPAIAIVLLLSAFSPAGWIKHVSREGHFTIEFPGQPAESIKVDTTHGVKTGTIHYATWFPNDSEGYMTTWTDLRKTYPKDKTIKQLLEESRDGATRAIHAADVITTAIVEGKEPYIAFAFTSNEFTGRGRIYIINKFQYSIIALYSRAAGVNADADRFIKSFRYQQ